MTSAGQSNLFSRFGFQVGEDGKIDNNSRAFFSKYKARLGPAIPDVAVTGDDTADWQTVALAANALIKEAVAQGWVKKGFDGNETAYANAIRAVTLIPAATEWAYAPYEVLRDTIVQEIEVVTTENGYSVNDATVWEDAYDDVNEAGRIGNPACDWRTSLDALQNQLPNVGLVNLFVTWYGDDLRCGQCNLYPAVVRNAFDDVPQAWSCNGVSRSAARVVSSVDGNAAFGGTPDDAALIDTLKDLKARKLKIAFTPFILMDIPAGNTLEDPDTGAAGQPVYPWRGRIAKAFATADKTIAVAVEVAAFVAQYRAFVLHYAHLCASAGGMDMFILGTELRGLTWLRDAAGSYPFVAALKTLAADVKAILPDAKLTYAADWSEYFGHRPADGSGDVYFHLDALWSDPNIDAVAIDNYWPLSDWRDGVAHLDYAPGRAVTDYDYLMSNIEGGEGYDWYYASAMNRTSQIRTGIADGAYGKPWVFRNKDIWNWWAHRHYNRLGGVETSTPTDWIPQSKPIWFTELGVPSIDKGTNQPNVFFDPKSSESATPYFSNGASDYLMQRRGIHTWLKFFDPADPAFTEANNPQSSVYDGRMVDLDRVAIYTWDARPYPWFPALAEVWSDSANWAFGHWIGGKLSSYLLPQEKDSMALATTYAPRHPYIVDPATGKLDKQYQSFFESIEFTQADPIANVPLNPTPSEAATVINALLATLRAQNRIAT